MYYTSHVIRPLAIKACSYNLNCHIMQMPVIKDVAASFIIYRLDEQEGRNSFEFDRHLHSGSACDAVVCHWTAMYSYVKHTESKGFLQYTKVDKCDILPWQRRCQWLDR